MTPPPQNIEMLTSAKLKLRWAAHYLCDLELHIDEFTKSRPYKLDHDQEKQTVRVVCTRALPDEISLMTGDVIHNARAALDHLAVDCALFFSTTCPEIVDPEKSSFPIGASEKDYGDTLKKKDTRWIKGHDRILDAINIAKPFAEGNPLLYELHQLDIQDKHRLILPVLARTKATLKNIRVWSSQNVVSLVPALTCGQLTVSDLTGSEGMNIAQFGIGNRVEFDYDPGDLSAELCFGSDCPTPNRPIVVGLRKMIGEVEKVIKSVDAVMTSIKSESKVLTARIIPQGNVGATL